MNILLLAENWAPRVGGIENYLQQLAQHLPNGSVQVVVPPATDATDQPQQGIKSIRRMKFFSSWMRPTWLPLAKKLKQQAQAEKIDILLCGKALFEGQVGLYLKKKLGVPYVVFTYAMEIETWASTRRTKRKLQHVLQQADRVVYINDITKKKLVELGVTEKQLVKIWPGIDDQYFTPVADDVVQRTLATYKIRQPYILCVARLVPRKGIDTLIEGFARLDQTKFGNHQLVIVGTGPEQDNLQKLIADEMMDRNVKLLGFVPTVDLPALYTGATTFALTPRQLGQDMEGFGIVYVEAAACGLPALATQTGGASEAVVHKETGLVIQPDSAEAVREALTVLLADANLRQNLATQAKKRAYDQFRWQKRSLLVKGVLDAIMTEQLLKQSPQTNGPR